MTQMRVHLVTGTLSVEQNVAVCKDAVGTKRESGNIEESINFQRERRAFKSHRREAAVSIHTYLSMYIYLFIMVALPQFFLTTSTSAG